MIVGAIVQIMIKVKLFALLVGPCDPIESDFVTKAVVALESVAGRGILGVFCIGQTEHLKSWTP